MQEPPREDKVEKLWGVTYLLMFAGAIVCIVLGFLALKQLSQSAMLLDILRGGVNTREFLQNLSSDDEYLVVRTLQTLGEKGDASAIEQAHYLLLSEKESIWFNAALYLANSGDDSAVPFLIKGLDHADPEERARALQSLKRLTGEDFGFDRAKWIQWWNRTYPDSQFDFGEPAAGAQSPAAQDDGAFLVQDVAGPTVIICAGNPVAIAGVKPRAGDDPRRAQEFLAMLLLNQPVRLRFAPGPPTGPDGARSALVYWASEDASAFPGTAPPVALPLPIRKRRMINAYLVAAGFYDPAPETVQDAGFRAALDAELRQIARPDSGGR